MGVAIRQKGKGKGKPWCVLIAHNGKWKSIKVGDRTAAGATFAGVSVFKIDGRVSSYGSLFSHGTDTPSHDTEKNRGTGKAITMLVSTIPTVPTILCIPIMQVARVDNPQSPF